MPLPTPHKDEKKNTFMPRCMGDEEIKRSFATQSQRVAVCLSQWRKKTGEKPPETKA